MEWQLDQEEARIIGVLIEKQMATPEYYPLTLNALLQGCNQKSSRNPVVDYSQSLVRDAVDRLNDRALLHIQTSHDRKAARFDERLTKRLHCSPQERAVLCVLLLRGPQTSGEIKSRSSRLYSFQDLGEVNDTLNSLERREELPLISQLERAPGTKEPRYMHVFCPGDIEQPFEQHVAKAPYDFKTELEKVKEELQDLRREFEHFKNEFL